MCTGSNTEYCESHNAEAGAGAEAGTDAQGAADAGAEAATAADAVAAAADAAAAQSEAGSVGRRESHRIYRWSALWASRPKHGLPCVEPGRAAT